MCTKNCLRFGWRNIRKEDVEGKRVIEVGSYNVNGSLRDFVLSFKPSKYIGVDIQPGKCVDEICNADDLLAKFGKNSFDFVLSTEMLEHVEHWQKVISNFKNICCEGGIILITTRSKGFGKHDYPTDYWRYEIDDMKKIFEDCEIKALEKDTRHPGVFVRVVKPIKFVEKDLSSYQLYRIA